MDGSRDARVADAAVTGHDAGPPPECDRDPLHTSFAPSFDGDRDVDPSDFVRLRTGGPWAFLYRYGSGRFKERVQRVEARLVDATGTEQATVLVDELVGTTERVSHVRGGAIGEGLFVAWDRARTLEGGGIREPDIWHARVSAAGALTRDPVVLYDEAAVPFVETDAPADVWILRSHVRMSGAMTVVVPVLQHLDDAGRALGSDTRLTTYLPAGAEDITLRASSSWVAIAARASRAEVTLLPLDRDATPTGPAKTIHRIASLEDMVVTDQRAAIASTRRAGDMGRVSFVLTDASGEEIARMLLEETEVLRRPRAAVVRAWPGFVVVWRVGLGEGARLRAAGITSTGEVRVPPTDLLDVPYVFGKLFATSDGSVLTLAGRSKEPDGNHLWFARTCVPR